MPKNADPKVIVALDFAERAALDNFVSQIEPGSCRVKVGKEVFTRFGNEVVKDLTAKGFEVFLDLKFHDIPNTVAKACQAAADLGVWMLNVHALGGKAMLEAARESLENYGPEKPILIAVTILTSLSAAELPQVGLSGSVNENVARLALLTKQAGLDGVVCSAHEARTLRARLGNDFCLVTPGIRLADSKQDDQTRIMTPSQARSHGSSYLVIGRPITQAENPMQVLAEINSSLNLA